MEAVLSRSPFNLGVFQLDLQGIIHPGLFIVIPNMFVWASCSWITQWIGDLYGAPDISVIRCLLSMESGMCGLQRDVRCTQIRHRQWQIDTCHLFPSFKKPNSVIKEICFSNYLRAESRYRGIRLLCIRCPSAQNTLSWLYKSTKRRRAYVVLRGGKKLPHNYIQSEIRLPRLIILTLETMFMYSESLLNLLQVESL